MKTNKKISLEEIGKKLPFSVPQNYFEDFASQFDDRIGFKSAYNKKHIKPWMYIAAMFVGILMMGQVFYTVYKNNSTKNAENYELYVLSQVDETSLVDYYVETPQK